MVQAMINISEEANRVLNTVKARHGLRDKSAAIELIADYYDDLFEPPVKPAYAAKLLRSSRGKTIKFDSIEEFQKRYAPGNDKKLRQKTAKAR